MWIHSGKIGEKMKFEDLNIINEILGALKAKNYVSPTPIQAAAIGPVLAGKDLLGCAQTGTGKTAAFAIPILQNLVKNNCYQKGIKVLILTPTRELAIQIRDSFREYGAELPFKCSVIFGGVNQHSQVEVLKKGVDILVATPGRLLDLIKQKHAKLDAVQCLVLDEADNMLDMGFIHDVKRVVSELPEQRQTLLFSATMPEEIEELANKFLNKPEKVVITPVASTVDTIKQSLYYVDKPNKPALLLALLKAEDVESALIFTKTKHGADKLVRILEKNNIKSVAIHGNKAQNTRQKNLSDFKSRAVKILVATDIAARGIDISGLSHVFNYEMPDVPETYVHRIGRTGRANKTGIAISLANFDEKNNVKDIQRLIKKDIPVVYEHDFPMQILVKTPKQPPQKKFISNKSIQKKVKPEKTRNRKNYR